MRVYPTGRKVYVVQSRGPRGPKRRALGGHGELSCEEARKLASALIDRIRRGEETAPAEELTVAALAERFMRVHVVEHCKPLTIEWYRRILEKHVLPVLGESGIGDVGGAEVSGLHHRLRKTPRTADMAVDVLSRMFTLAEAWGLAPPGENPCRGLRRYRRPPRERFLALDEFRRLGCVLKECEAEGTEQSSMIGALRLLMLTGCRKSEILSLRWDDVDVTAGELRLRDAKSGPRMVHLTAPVAKVLDSLARTPGEALLFPGPGGGSFGPGFESFWRRIRSRAGLPDVRLHDLRHSYASRALALGEGLPAIGKLLGHAKISTTARYAHLMRGAEKVAAKRVGESIGSHLETQAARGE